MSSMNIAEAKNVLTKIFRHVIKTNKVQPPVALHSKPGIGKSAIVNDIIQDMQDELIREHGENNAPVVSIRDLRLSGMESSDVQGIPHVNPETGNMVFSTPEWFPDENEEPYGILFLDELPNADIDTQKAGYRIVHDRTIQNGRKLPNGWLVVMAGNNKSDKTGVNRLLPALANRFGSHIDVIPDAEAFISYAIKKGLHSAVISFLHDQSHFVHRFDPKNTEDHSFPSPRSWEFVSNYLNLFEDQMFSNENDGIEIDHELSTLISGAVGEAASAQFMSHLKYFHRMPNLSAIADGKENAPKLEHSKHDPGYMFALTFNLIQKVGERHKDPKAIENLKPVLDALGDEYTVVFFKNMYSVGTSVTRDLMIKSPMKENYQRIAQHLRRN